MPCCPAGHVLESTAKTNAVTCSAELPGRGETMERLRDPGLSAAAERAMRRWELRRQVERRQVAKSQGENPSAFCVTVSREAGSRGATVSRLVGEKLG